MAEEMSHVERLWKYSALGITSILFEEANPVLGGIAARQDELNLLLVFVAVTLGTWAASIALYYVGYWRIDWVRRRFPKKERLLDTALEIVRRNPWRASLAIRFAYWLRIPLPIACGAARVPVIVYTAASLVSCLVWSALFVALGYWASNTAMQALAFTKRPDVRIAAVAVVLALVLAGLYVRRRRRMLAEQTAHVLTGEHIPIMTTAERAAPLDPRRRVPGEDA
jgi:membrane protein DedA with SNARE-associated domain